MQSAIRLYRLLNILSFDIVAGAVVGSLFFAKLLHVHILPYGIVALGLTVWIIYTADHLRDAKAIGVTASSARHRFHQRYFKILFIFLVVAIIIDAAVILFTRKPVLEWGILLSVVVFIYLVIQRYLKVLKELFVACLYTCGVLLPALSVTTVELNFLYRSTILQFFLIAYINLLIFSWFDSEEDMADHQHSFSTILGKSFTTWFVFGLGLVNLCISGFLILKFGAYVPTLILTLMNVVLLFIFLLRKRMDRQAMYRLLGDAIFMIPLFYLI
jgi:hypothetical protein